MNCRIFYNNIIRNASVTVTNEAESYEKKYLYDEIVGTKYRTQNIGQHVIQMDLYTSTPVEGIVVLDHNILPGDAVYQFQASSNPDFSEIDESEDLILKTRSLKQRNTNGALETVTRRDAYCSVSWNRRYYRLIIEKLSGNFIEIGGIYLLTGNYELEKNYSWGYSGGIERSFTSVSNERGVVFKKQKYSRRLYTMQFQGLSSEQKTMFDEEIGENDFVVYFPNGYEGDLYYGSIEFDVPQNTYHNLWSTNATFTELI